MFKGDTKYLYKPDTVYVDKIPAVEVEKTTAPNTLQIQKTADKPKRAAVEKQPEIITGVEIENGELGVTTIDTAGILKREEFKISPADQIKIDSSGRTAVAADPKTIKKENRKKFWQKVKKTVNTVAIVTAGVATAALVLILKGGL